MDIRRTDLSGHLILIVEEQPMLAINLQVALEQAGAELIVTHGPQEASARVHQFTFSAAIVDPTQRALVRQLQQQGVFVVSRPTSRHELFARLATSIH
jgi:ActR/RegA family two-component response regulator